MADIGNIYTVDPGLDRIGVAIKFPLEVNGAGRLKVVRGFEVIWQNVKTILDTVLGEAPMDPHFGVNIGVYDSFAFVYQIAHRVGVAIRTSEPRVDYVGIDIQSVEENGDVLLAVTLRESGSIDEHIRVFPLYGLAT